MRPRVAATVDLDRVDFTEFTPEPARFLGQAACIQLEFFEALGHAVAGAPGLAEKEALSRVAGVALRRHGALIDEVRKAGGDPVEVMAPFAADIAHYRESITGADQWELLLGIHVTTGILDDYFRRLAGGLPGEQAVRVAAILAPDALGAGVIAAQLQVGIEAEPGLADRLALWGRSLVGDALLLARRALRGSERDGAERAVEPVFTELIAEHTRRMDALGLTA
nr:ferritin-like fold-containing protein [Agromyces seonyuensis]